MVLADHEIQRLVAEGVQLVEPFNEDQLQPASYDIRLSGSFRVFLPHRVDILDLGDPASWTGLTEPVYRIDAFVLQPGQFVLGATVEQFALPYNIVGRLEGKSSLARFGMPIHATGGFIDPGFSGTITLEIFNMLPVPIRVRPGQKIGQMCFMQMNSAAEYPYATKAERENRYQGQVSATASRATPQPR